MTHLMKTLIASAAVAALSSTAFAAGHELDVGSAMLDVSLDTNGDGDVTVDEIIDGNMAFFDTDGNGAIDADERGVAEQRVEAGGTITMEEMGVEMSTSMSGDAMAEFDADAARLDTSLDTNGDGEVSDDEIIDGNMAVFDTDGNGAIDADERGIADEMLMQ